jgi:hypothetical protein
MKGVGDDKVVMLELAADQFYYLNVLTFGTTPSL